MVLETKTHTHTHACTQVTHARNIEVPGCPGNKEKERRERE